MRRRRVTGRVAAGLLVATLLGACSSAAEEPAAEAPAGSGDATSAVAVPESGSEPVAPDDPALDIAVSEPQEDPYYPRVGDPGVDALHYQLDLAWSPETRTLDAAERLVFRATADADRFQLDLGEALTVEEVSVDGEAVDFREDGKDLVVRTPVTADQRYTVELRYGGTPKPVAAPTTRADFSSLGWTTTEEGETWTMQEPFGAYSYYAVNDHPSDKALYDFTLSTPAPWTGVANGELTSQEVLDGNTVTTWHLDEPAASYLVTVAMGDFRMGRGRSESGVRLTYWTPRGDPVAQRQVRSAERELGWVEDKLGPYPFSTLGVLVVPSRSGMETQTMITLGNTDYTLSPEVMVHELVHQWWGDQVTPETWPDLWMNEGMAMYLQALWQSEQYDVPVEDYLGEWDQVHQVERDSAGPPADYNPAMFGEGNVYHPPALMWHQLRGDLGDALFWRLVRAWPVSQDNGNASYDEITAWWSRESGRDLRPFFDRWLLGEAAPEWP